MTKKIPRTHTHNIKGKANSQGNFYFVAHTSDFYQQFLIFDCLLIQFVCSFAIRLCVL